MKNNPTSTQDETGDGFVRKTLKALGALVFLALVERWMPEVTLILAIAVTLYYARFVWRTVAGLPPREVAELTIAASVCLLAGAAWKFGVGEVINAGILLVVVLPLTLRRSRTRAAGEIPAATDGEAPSTEPADATPVLPEL